MSDEKEQSPASEVARTMASDKKESPKFQSRVSTPSLEFGRTQ